MKTVRDEAESRTGGSDGGGGEAYQGLPFPGDDLAFRVAGTADRTWFFSSGRQSANDLLAMLAVVGKQLHECERILDFGCGCGRILLWLKDVANKSSLFGTDIDATAIEWAHRNLSYVEFRVNQPLPPLDFPDAFFDFVYCHSVFTHIDEMYQDRWLAELRRVVKPTGLVLLSVNGEHAFQKLEEAWSAKGADPSSLRATRDSLGLLHMRDDQWVGGPFPDFYHSTFHTPAYVFAHWSRFFRIRAYVPQGSLAHQDFVLLEPTDVLPSRPTRSSVDDPIGRVARLLARGPNRDHPRRFGVATTLARKAVLRILRYYSANQRELHGAVLDALRDLDRDRRDLKEVVRQQGERIERIENRP